MDEDSNWWKGRHIENSVVGSIPRNFVKILWHNNLDRVMQCHLAHQVVQKRNSVPLIMNAICTHPYEAVNPLELSMKKGDLISVFRTDMYDYFTGRNERTGKMGRFPGEFVIESEGLASSSQLPHSMHYRSSHPVQNSIPSSNSVFNHLPINNSTVLQAH